MMWSLLPFFCLVGTIGMCQKSSEFSEALVKGSLIWGGLIFFFTYGLSFFSLLYPRYLLGLWLVYVGVLGVLLLFQRKKMCWSFSPSKHIVPFVAILLLTLMTGLLYPPNNWDSMTYHLPKVMHWLQNHTLAPYPTAIPRQVSLAPLTEIILLQIYGLSGGDWFFPLVQWFAFLGMILLVAAIAAQLGAGGRGQMAAALFMATLPMAIIQASSTQTDNAVGLWLACCVYCFLAWRNSRRMAHLLFFGLALGLAILTKGTAYPLALPFVLFIGWKALTHPRPFLIQGMLAGCLVIGLNLPHIYYNYTEYDNIFGSGGMNIIKTPTPVTLAATLAANIASNDPAWIGKKGVERGYHALFSVLGIPPDDPVVFPWGGIHQRSRYSTHEDIAQNPVHTLFLLVIFGAYLFRSFPLPPFYTRCVLASVVFFCLFLTWQPWITRLQVPIFALAAPLFGMACETINRPRRHIIALGFLALAALPPLFFLQSRPLVPWRVFHTRALTWTTPRSDLYFSNRPALKQSYREVVSILAAAKPSCIGLYLNADSWEYPLWALLRQEQSPMPHIIHVADDPDFSCSPTYLFVLDKKFPQEIRQHDGPKLYERKNGEYRQIY